MPTLTSFFMDFFGHGHLHIGMHKILVFIGFSPCNLDIPFRFSQVFLLLKIF